MRRVNVIVRTTTIFLALLLCTYLVSPALTLSAENSNAYAGEKTTDLLEQADGVVASYEELYHRYADVSAYDGWIDVKSGVIIDVPEKAMVSPDGENDAVLISDANKWAEWQITIETDGLYGMSIEYYPLDNKSMDIGVCMLIDGKVPFSEVNPFLLRRKWVSVYGEEEPFEKDDEGNDLQPGQEEKPCWIKYEVADRSGIYTEPYRFRLTAGTHTIRLVFNEGEFAVKRICFGSNVAENYNSYISKYSDKKINGEAVYQQAEITESTNDSAISPAADRLTASTVPNDPAFIRLNTIGSNGWSSQGDEISWRVNIKEAGLYRIAIRARQKSNASMKAYRSLLVNGELPFAEAEDFSFPYSGEWYTQVLSGENGEFLFYLEPDDIISLVCTTGKMAPVLKSVQSEMNDLNNLYLEIISHTSANPDIFQDYELEVKIPDLASRLEGICSRLKKTSKQIQKITDSDGSQASVIDYAISILDVFAKDPYLISQQLTSLKTALETLSSLLQTINSCPLELDYLVFAPKNADIYDGEIGFFKTAAFMAKQFIYSFSKDYNFGKATSKKINVWVSTGRDQVQVIKNLIRNDFSNKTGIDVSLNIVDTGQTLIRASLAGKGPDAALMMAISIPLNLAARGAVTNLNDYDVEEIKRDFHSSALRPFYYKNGLYALPETQTFSMLFYRTDIFARHGISPPQTWEEFYQVMEILQSNNMMVGVPETGSENMGISLGINLFEALLIQNGGSYYTDDLTKTKFDEQVAYEAFDKWVNLYKDYGLDRQFDFYSRFRTGEMPMAIQSLSSYASLQQAAPELQGLWSIAPIPGTETEKGINNSQPSDVTGCIMLKSAVERGVDSEVAQFLKWWVSSETQTSYGVSLERNLGVFGRYYTANRTAFDGLAWTKQEKEIINAQWDNIYNQPQVLGNYVIQRSLTSALRACLDKGYRSSRALRTYNYDMNEELERKQNEFR